MAYTLIGHYFFTTHPDYNIGVVAPYYLPEDTLQALQTQLGQNGLAHCVRQLLLFCPAHPLGLDRCV